MNQLLLDLVTEFVPNDTDAMELYEKVLAYAKDCVEAGVVNE